MFDSFKKIFSHAAGTVSKNRYRIGNDPSTDWLIILAGFVVCTALIILASLSVYLPGSVDVSGASTTASSSAELISSSTLSRVIDFYGARGSRADEARATSTPVDPSR